MNKRAFVLLLSGLFLLAGCASFKPTRVGRFINMDNELVHVEYGEDKHTEKFRGLDFTFKEVVHLHLPDGKKVVCLQTVSTDGMRYISKDKKYVYYEKGPYCILFYDGQRIFEGIFCHEPKKQ